MLVDAGPLVSVCDKGQSNHSHCLAVLETAAAPVTTTWACLTEALHIVGRIGGFRLQRHLWALFQHDIVRLHAHSDAELGRMATLMDRYQNVPMDFADASLVSAAEASGDRSLLTTEGDFHIYRFADGGAFNVFAGSP